MATFGEVQVPLPDAAATHVACSLLPGDLSGSTSEDTKTRQRRCNGKLQVTMTSVLEKGSAETTRSTVAFCMEERGARRISPCGHLIPRNGGRNLRVETNESTL